MFRKIKIFKTIAACGALILIASGTLSAQQNAAALHDYVGVIHQSYHPDVVAYMNKLKEMEKKRGKADSVKSIEAFLKGGFGSGFVYVDGSGNNYILTNFHVVTKAYSLSIEFESADGKKTTHSGLNIVAADADADLALLSFSSGEKPFKNGLNLAAKAPAEGDTVFSAGFPGLGRIPLWQFAQGIISNGRVVIPPDEDDDREYGPWLQHTAQIDAGNSGGPLLIAQSGAPTGYAVVGINNASGVRRQAANYAIPVATVRDFITSSLAQQSADEKRRKLEARVDAFIKALAETKAVYSRIARYLSNECVAASAEFAITEVEKRANRTVQNDIFDKSILEVLDYSVAWTVEDQMRSIAKSVILRPAKGSLAMNVDGTWTAPLVFGETTIDMIWISEYGMWRIKSAGGLTGNKAAMSRKTADEEDEKKEAKKLRAEYTWEIFAHYMYLGMGGSEPRGSALALSFDRRTKSGMRYGAQLVSNFDEFGIFQLSAGYVGAITSGNKIAIMPFGDLGAGISWFEKDTPSEDDLLRETDSAFDVVKKTALGISLSGGIMFRTAAVPGLSAKVAYQLNLFDPTFLSEKRVVPLPDSMHSILVGIGYAFN